MPSYLIMGRLLMFTKAWLKKNDIIYLFFIFSLLFCLYTGYAANTKMPISSDISTTITVLSLRNEYLNLENQASKIEIEKQKMKDQINDIRSYSYLISNQYVDKSLRKIFPGILDVYNNYSNIFISIQFICFLIFIFWYRRKIVFIF